MIVILYYYLESYALFFRPDPVLKGRPRKKTNSFSKAPSTGDSASKTTDGLTIKNSNEHSISALSTAGRRIKRKLHADQVSKFVIHTA
jgi:hypothetical protein